MNQYQAFPEYITVLDHNENTYIGIIKIKSTKYTTLYCLDLMSKKEREEILQLAEDWWFQSNRMIPVCLFFQEEMEKFENYTKRFDTPQIKFISGPQTSLSDLPQKRIKRRNVALKKRT